jgi:hypothetical protein
MLSQQLQCYIKNEAIRYIGKKYDRIHFNCLTFARLVYQKVGLTLPPLQLNVTLSQLKNPPVGFVVYLRRKNSKNICRFTHVAILMDDRMCIHCSYFFGGSVVVSRLDELLDFYSLAVERGDALK